MLLGRCANSYSWTMFLCCSCASSLASRARGPANGDSGSTLGLNALITTALPSDRCLPRYQSVAGPERSFVTISQPSKWGSLAMNAPDVPQPRALGNNEATVRMRDPLRGTSAPLGEGSRAAPEGAEPCLAACVTPRARAELSEIAGSARKGANSRAFRCWQA